ncbi:MAG TPA: DDE-type integrase/transposase/recombinase [Candidatus Binatia bacterium]|nr:DDE-type integrase/transposase/recombinase [Candidatus Binatia bacterium]
MPWEQTSAMDQRVKFIADWLSHDGSKIELCRAYGISRPTADKWIGRYQQGGVKELEQRSHAAHCHPNQTPEEICQMLIATKLYRQSWGPKKVLDYLRENGPELNWPADSTAGQILKRAGLVKRRVRRQHVWPYSEPFGSCHGPNQIWSADFKGDFVLGNYRRCYPLTLSDNFSRYLLLCRALEHPSYQAVRPWFEWAFRNYGLPQAIRTDNGAPFASLAIGGVSELSKWWIQLGIRPERIKPGKPNQNGRHERMHRTLKHEVPPQPTHQRQQNRFDLFLEQYNWQRSHEALGRKTPGSFYCASPRRYPGKLPPVEYPSGVIVRRVRYNGEIKWRGELIYVSQVLAQEPLGLKQIDDHKWEVRYSFHLLATIDQRAKRILPAKIWYLR